MCVQPEARLRCGCSCCNGKACGCGCNGGGGGGGGGAGVAADASWAPGKILEELAVGALAEDGRFDEFRQLSDQLRLSLAEAEEDELFQTTGDNDGGGDNFTGSSCCVSGSVVEEEVCGTGIWGGADDGLGGSLGGRGRRPLGGGGGGGRTRGRWMHSRGPTTSRSTRIDGAIVPREISILSSSSSLL